MGFHIDSGQLLIKKKQNVFSGHTSWMLKAISQHQGPETVMVVVVEREDLMEAGLCG